MKNKGTIEIEESRMPKSITWPVGILDQRVDDGYGLARQPRAGLCPQGR